MKVVLSELVIIIWRKARIMPPLCYGSVVQWIEQQIPVLPIWVRFPSESLQTESFDILYQEVWSLLFLDCEEHYRTF